LKSALIATLKGYLGTKTEAEGGVGGLDDWKIIFGKQHAKAMIA